MSIKFAISVFFLFSCQLQDNGHIESDVKSQPSKCVLKTGWYLVDYSRKGCERKFTDDSSSYSLQHAPLITSSNVVKVDDMKFVDETPGFLISFDAKGTKQWKKVTGSHVGDIFAFVLNDTLLIVQANTAEISSGKAFFPLRNRSPNELQRIKEAILPK